MEQKKSLPRQVNPRPQKRLGQHFLQDQGLVKKIIALAGFTAQDRVLEIGPGLGALTIPLAAGVRRIIAVEKDAELVARLQERLDRAGIENVYLINQDILRFHFMTGADGDAPRLGVIGNLPYNISSPLLEKLIQNRECISRAVLMFQRELAQRLMSEPGRREYGALTVLIQYYARVSGLLALPKEAFFPKPKVDSLVLELDFSKPFTERAHDETWFKKVVKAAFARKRKTILNSLRGSLPDLGVETIRRALMDCGITPGDRAEEVPLKAFIGLSHALKVAA